MKPEQKAWAPLWLEYSGLPQLLAEKVRGGIGWPLLRKLIELDCALNAQPDTVETTLAELEARTAIAPAAAQKAILSMRKLKLLSCFLPEHEEETALFKIRVPLVTPRTPEQIRQQWPELFGGAPQYFRYVDDSPGDSSDLHQPPDPLLQEVVDLYFNTVGTRMNAFILDELTLLSSRFRIDLIRRTFRRAQQNEIRSLSWVVREMVRLKAKDEKKTEQDG